ncbi:hypothetical protein CEE45_16080 [Candidatus Heimdallarchaeota archaeon B3_Heim]|nr:MAG: hypothetical protein CEE45_16080 [Candidatus Heimdallarchaeota archaeon B3_Heim]
MEIDQKVIEKIPSNHGMLIRLKKTESCCSFVVEPEINIIPLSQLDDFQNQENVTLEKIHKIPIIIENEVLDIYRDLNEFKIKLGGFLRKKLVLNLSPEIIMKERE